MRAMLRCFRSRTSLGWWAGNIGTVLLATTLLDSALVRAADDKPDTAVESSEKAKKGDREVVHRGTPDMSPDAQVVANRRSVFSPDPRYPKSYDSAEQIEIYGGKYQVLEQRPIIEIGQPLYVEGPLNPSFDDIGKKNLVQPAFSVFGDFRTAFSYNNNGRNQEVGRLSARLNLETDLQITATERCHAQFRPIDKNPTITRVDFLGPNQSSPVFELNGNPHTLFCEGDLGNIVSGLTNTYQSYDLPFAVGLTPLLFQNGIWANSTLIGGVATIPARNSATLNIANMDFTFFAGDNTSTPAIKDPAGNLVTTGVAAYGAAAFVEANEGYWEAGIGYIDDHRGLPINQSYGTATIAFTKRYGGWLSNSVRVIADFGQDPAAHGVRTANGFIFLMENSLISSKELVFVPYLNLFAGFRQPQSLMRNADAGGILFNTGILFETDGLTNFPKLDDSGFDTYGGALGVEYLFDLDQQIVLEVGTVQIRGADIDPGRQAKGPQYGIGLRYQRNLTNSLLFRLNLMYAERENPQNVPALGNIAGVVLELRQKF
jgi:hypothetical protein